MKDSLDPYILDCPYDKPLPKVVPKVRLGETRLPRNPRYIPHPLSQPFSQFTSQPKPPPSKHQKMAAYDQKAPPIKDDEKFTKYFKMQKVRSDEERSDELTTQLQAAKTPRAHTSAQDSPPS